MHVTHKTKVECRSASGSCDSINMIKGLLQRGCWSLLQCVCFERRRISAVIHRGADEASVSLLVEFSPLTPPTDICFPCNTNSNKY